jgi:signal transduction histidine kinase/CheY-like chemotaxis protein
VACCGGAYRITVLHRTVPSGNRLASESVFGHPLRVARSSQYTIVAVSVQRASSKAGDSLTVADLSTLLRDNRDAIVSCFVAAVQRLEGPLQLPGASRSLLVDHIPQFLDEIAAELFRVPEIRASQDAVDTSQTARQHGSQRWSLGYDLQAVIREYGILRHCILQTATEEGLQLSNDEFDVLAKCLSVGVAEAATEYAAFRDAELNARNLQLEFLAEAGNLLTSSLDYRSTLRHLTSLVVPRLADWCAVQLAGSGADDMALAHVDPTKVEVLREIFRRYPLPPDSPHGYPHVMRTGEPQLVSVVAPGVLEAAAMSAEHLELLKAINVCSWIVVPLRIQGKMFGALNLAYSDSGRHYAEADMALASELARRAAAAIDNSRIYAMSQEERSRVEAATRAKDEFVAMVSHELRTPLNAITGWLRLMKTGSLPEAKRQHAFEVIERNTQAQTQIVGDLLDISRAITGKLRINLTQIDLTNVIELAIEGVRPAADTKRIRIEADFDPKATVIRGDGDRLQQVAWNLLANAVKFTPKNGTVRVQLRRVDSDVELIVSDTGRGIESSFLPHVFDSFRQAETVTSREHGGLGIGLSIAKHIVEIHGGSIQVESQGSGKGATFIVRVPVSPLVSATLGVTRVRAAREPRVDSPLPVGLESMRVLVVDDEPDAREMVAYLLQTCGIDVRVAGCAADALIELEQFKPHVMVSDIGMPKEDGYALIRSVRSSGPLELRGIPAIALTAFARNEDRARALVEGFNVHMEKPVEPTELVQAIVSLAGDVPR